MKILINATKINIFKILIVKITTCMSTDIFNLIGSKNSTERDETFL